MIVSASLENRFAGRPTTLEQIEERSGVVQEKSYKEYSERVLFIFVDHEQVVAVVKIGLARTFVTEGTAAEVIDDGLRDTD